MPGRLIEFKLVAEHDVIDDRCTAVHRGSYIIYDYTPHEFQLHAYHDHLIDYLRQPG